MWERRELKQYAKDFLRKHYWKAFLVCLIVTLLNNSGGSSTSGNELLNKESPMVGIEVEAPSRNGNPIVKFVTDMSGLPLAFIISGILPIIIIISIVLMITVGFALEVGQSRFFLDGFKGDVRIGKLFSTFNSLEYLPIVKTQILRNIYIFLWTLLLIIPGIIKSYQYRFVPYILSEQPNLPTKQVLEMSKDMTDGHKMDMFVLDLSFIGWYLLGFMILGLGGLFVDPYVETTYARLFNVLSGNGYIHDEYDSYDMSIQ